jgi:hypothetical protein
MFLIIFKDNAIKHKGGLQINESEVLACRESSWMEILKMVSGI